MNRKEFNEKTSGKKFVAVFTKKDGSERKILATTSFDFIPEEHQPKDDGSEKVKKVAEFKVGDKVVLKSGSPILSIFLEMTDDGQKAFECRWNDGDDVKVGIFKESMIEKYSPYVNVFDLGANGWRKLNLETLKTLDLVKT
jgi:uncharacterized protein YodC (DUF2158 family)